MAPAPIGRQAPAKASVNRLFELAVVGLRPHIATAHPLFRATVLLLPLL